jgi:hypothetical protein
MINLTSSADARNSEVTPTFIVGTVAHDRAWWAAEAARTRTDWRSLADAALEPLVSVGVIRLEQSILERACEQADREQLPRPSRSGAAMAAPPTTIEALMLSLRRGVDELVKPNALQRLSVLDEGQIEDVCCRVQAFQPAIAPAWSAEDADLLISVWRKLREHL